MSRRITGALTATALAATGALVAPTGPAGAAGEPVAAASAGSSATAASARRGPRKPARIRKVTVKPGPRPGTMTIRWKTSGKRTTKFRIDTALSMFSPYHSPLPRKGRHFRHFFVGKHKRKVVLSRKQLRRAGAPLASANQVFFRVSAIHKAGKRKSKRDYPYLMAGRPRGLGAQEQGASIRVANYNVRTTSPREAGDRVRAWSVRGPKVARQIAAKEPGIVTIQELSPGPVDNSFIGKPHQGQARHRVAQTVKLVEYLRQAGAGSYRLVRDSSYTYGASGTQGARILYDASRYDLLSRCPDTNAAGQEVNGSCAFQIPMRAKDSESLHRWAAFARFRDRRTGVAFWVVSAHLDSRNGSNRRQARSFEKLRARQLRFVIDRMDALRQGEPVIVGMDQNTWQNTSAGFYPHRALIEHGYFDTAAAAKVRNLRYPTKNKAWNQRRQRKASTGFGARLDVIATLDMRGAERFQIALHPKRKHPGSDHNMVVADLRLPAG